MGGTLPLPPIASAVRRWEARREHDTQHGLPDRLQVAVDGRNLRNVQIHRSPSATPLSENCSRASQPLQRLSFPLSDDVKTNSQGFFQQPWQKFWQSTGTGTDCVTILKNSAPTGHPIDQRTDRPMRGREPPRRGPETCQPGYEGERYQDMNMCRIPSVASDTRLARRMNRCLGLTERALNRAPNRRRSE